MKVSNYDIIQPKTKETTMAFNPIANNKKAYHDYEILEKFENND